MHNKHTTDLSSLFFFFTERQKQIPLILHYIHFQYFWSTEQFEMNSIISLTIIQKLSQFYFGLELYFFGFVSH